MANAFAIKTGGEIDIRTVSPTAKGAKVNWLCTACKLLLPQMMDHMIDPVFEFEANDRGAVCVSVVVTESILS